jgi:outer membrane protein TolC
MASAPKRSSLPPTPTSPRLAPHCCRGQKAIAESRERELVETYRKAVLSAFADVEQALAGTTRLGQQEQLQNGVQTRAQESLRLAEIRYRAGADDLLTVLDAQRTLFSAQEQLAQIELNRLNRGVSGQGSSIGVTEDRAGT